jgi:hypothetical protein
VRAEHGGRLDEARKAWERLSAERPNDAEAADNRDRLATAIQKQPQRLRLAGSVKLPAHTGDGFFYQVGVHSGDDPAGQYVAVARPSSGSFEFFLAPGRYHVVLVARGFRSKSADVDLQKPQEVSLELAESDRRN